MNDISNLIDQAITTLNDKRNIKDSSIGIAAIDKVLCELNETDLSYYKAIGKIILGLRFNTTVFKAQKYLNFYYDIFTYLAPKFEMILSRFTVNSNDEDEAIVVNDVCATLINTQINFLQTLLMLLAKLLLFGIVPVKRATKKHCTYICRYEYVAFTVLNKYNTKNQTIIDNRIGYENMYNEDSKL